MRSELLYTAVLLAPWALVLIAMFLYRKRRIRKAQSKEGAS